MTKLKTYLIISEIFPIKVHQTIDKVVKITHYYAEFYIIVNLPRCIHHFNLINNMGHVRILGTEPGITFAWIIHLRPVEIRSGVVLYWA